MGKLYLIAGHGAGDPGACANGFQEAERVRALCNCIKKRGGDQVVVLDPARNWYADNGISSLKLNRDDFLMECHMDSAGSTARGGHVIICSGLMADKYDKALADMLKKHLPGRSEIIVERGNLANPKRAKSKGINYRLVEFGFISNKTDLQIFNSKMDEIAKDVLKCFGLTVLAKQEQQETGKKEPFKSYLARVISDTLDVKAGAGSSYKTVVKVKKYDVYTIVEEKKASSTTWGRLKSGMGWIDLRYTKKII